MDERSDRGEFYPGGSRSDVPPGTSTDKVDRVNLGEVGESYTLKEVKNKVNQIVRAIAPVAVCLAICAQAATAPLEDLPNTAPVVTNEEDAVAMAAVGALGGAVSNDVAELSSAFDAKLGGATNALTVQMAELRSADSNRIEATFAKRSEIPAAPDLSPYALKSELPQDYLVENDITNFATRAWIASQGYATGAGMTARLDAQDLAIDAATNWLWAAHLAEAARLNSASNALAQAHMADVNALRMGTNMLATTLRQATNALTAAHAADMAALRAGTNTMDSAWRMGTNALWQATASGTNRLWLAMASASNRVTAATNALAAAHRTDVNALRAMDTALSNRLEQTRSSLDSAWRAGTNTLWQATASGTNRLWLAMASASNRVTAATNALAAAHRTDVNALRAMDTALSNRLEQTRSSLDSAWRAGTNTLWQATASGTNRLWLAMASASNRVTAATNALAAAHRTDVNALRAMDTALSNRLEQVRSSLDSAWRAGTNAVVQTVESESNRLDSATNKVWQSALRADETLQREIDALRIVAADSNAVTRLVTADGSTWQDATGTVWQVQVATSLWTVVHSWTTNDVNWSGPWWWGVEGAGDDYYDGSGWYISSSSLTPMRMSEDPYASEIVVEWTYLGEEEHSVTTRCTRTVQWLTNAIDRVAYTNDVAKAIWQLADQGTVRNAEQLVDTMTGDSVTARDVINATNSKQDALPYPTNAIPYAAISGAPSGAPVWQVVSFDANTSLSFVTNGMAVKAVNGELFCDRTGWPDGAAMFTRITLVPGDYDIDSHIRLVGYGTWPTNDFQSVWWRSGTNIFVNILLEE